MMNGGGTAGGLRSNKHQGAHSIARSKRIPAGVSRIRHRSAWTSHRQRTDNPIDAHCTAGTTGSKLTGRTILVEEVIEVVEETGELGSSRQAGPA
jgi:hypothetical protein